MFANRIIEANATNAHIMFQQTNVNYEFGATTKKKFCAQLSDYVTSDQLTHAIDCSSMKWIEQSRRRQTSFGCTYRPHAAVRKPPRMQWHKYAMDKYRLMDDGRTMPCCPPHTQKELLSPVCNERPTGISKCMRQLNSAHSASSMRVMLCQMFLLQCDHLIRSTRYTLA